MEGARVSLWTCSHCLRAQQSQASLAARVATINVRRFTASPLRKDKESDPEDGTGAGKKEPGALSRRLTEMAEETMDTGSKSDRKMMADAGFSDELKKQLEERIAQIAFKTESQQAFSQASMPTYAGRGTQDNAAAPTWQGSESVEDAALRMLDDSYKKLRSPTKSPRIPRPVDLRPKPKAKGSRADRLANARDKTSIYAFSQQNDLTEEEREKFRKELKDRFTPAARPMPVSIQGLTSLANERIEDAIARGQFKNIQRGKGVNTERDYVANSPFLDTTEYFMNKIIQKQEIVPPWIEKQQELVKNVNSFRSRLRNDWRRHAARSISASGGSIQDQVRRAKGFALAEEIVNPRQVKKQDMTGISSDGTLVNISVEERMASGVVEDSIKENKHPEMEIKVTETTAEGPQATSAHATSESAEIQATATFAAEPTTSTGESPMPDTASPPSSQERVLPMPYPLRDPDWEKLENSYQKLAVEELNSFTRSYNLMAPKVAQKPYYKLERELKRCFSDVAPLLADEILQRSRTPPLRISIRGHKEGGVMEKFAGDRAWKGHEAQNIRDEGDHKGYGFKQFWKDLFRKETRQKEMAQASRAVAPLTPTKEQHTTPNARCILPVTTGATTAACLQTRLAH